MEIHEALGVIRKLADGLRPETGQAVSGNSMHQHPRGSARAEPGGAGARVSTREGTCAQRPALQLPASLVTIQASTTGPSAKAKPLSVAVAATPEYMLTDTNSTFTAQVNATATFDGFMTTVNGHSSSVTLSCGSGSPPTCTVTCLPLCRTVLKRVHGGCEQCPDASLLIQPKCCGHRHSNDQVLGRAALHGDADPDLQLFNLLDSVDHRCGAGKRGFWDLGTTARSL